MSIVNVKVILLKVLEFTFCSKMYEINDCKSLDLDKILERKMKTIAKKLVEIGWKLREGQMYGPYWIQFPFAPVYLLIGALLVRVNFPALGMYPDFYAFSEALNHLVYWIKILGKANGEVAQRISQKSLEIMRENRPEKRASALRARISVLMEMGEFLSVLPLIDEYLAVQTKSKDVGDMLTHRALVQLRLGQAKKAQATIEQAIDLIDEVAIPERDYTWGVWKTKACMVHAQILLAQCKDEDALAKATLALETAQLFKAHARELEARLLLEQVKTYQNKYFLVAQSAT